MKSLLLTALLAVPLGMSAAIYLNEYARQTRLTRLIRERQPDVVQTYMGRATRLTRLPAGSRALHVARLGGYYKIDGYYRHAHAWVGNTQDICDFMVKEGLPRERVFYIGNFVPQPRAVSAEEVRALRAHLGLADNAFVIFAVGDVNRMTSQQSFRPSVAQSKP